jgi:hypothetical protein
MRLARGATHALLCGGRFMGTSLPEVNPNGLNRLKTRSIVSLYMHERRKAEPVRLDQLGRNPEIASLEKKQRGRAERTDFHGVAL